MIKAELFVCVHAKVMNLRGYLLEWKVVRDQILLFSPIQSWGEKSHETFKKANYESANPSAFPNFARNWGHFDYNSRWSFGTKSTETVDSVRDLNSC